LMVQFRKQPDKSPLSWYNTYTSKFVANFMQMIQSFGLSLVFYSSAKRKEG
jgi:hypothetical protein